MSWKSLREVRRVLVHMRTEGDFAVFKYRGYQHWQTPTEVRLDRSTWRDLGCPATLTVTMERPADEERG